MQSLRLRVRGSDKPQVWRPMLMSTRSAKSRMHLQLHTSHQLHQRLQPLPVCEVPFPGGVQPLVWPLSQLSPALSQDHSMRRAHSISLTLSRTLHLHPLHAESRTLQLRTQATLFPLQRARR